jgi:uncharacterized membrane protein
MQVFRHSNYYISVAIETLTGICLLIAALRYILDRGLLAAFCEILAQRAQ